MDKTKSKEARHSGAQFVYVTYIDAPADKVWQALTVPAVTARYWQHENVSDWRAGSRWEHRSTDPDRVLRLTGKILESNPPVRLVMTWAFPADRDREEKHSTVTFLMEPYRGITRLTMTHDALEPGSEMLRGVTEGWPRVLSSLKSLLEVGRPLPKLW
jgi:uncharacterized protein YndB with AHSA1/START domain